jgi:2-dehydropantoate 2-reductase
MKIIVLGAGAIGSLYAAKLSARHDVTVVARRAHADAINRDGLRVVGREELVCRLRAGTAVESIEPDTLVLLATKVNDNRQAIQAISGRLRADTTILCVQNGLGGEDVVKQVVAAAPTGARATVLRAVTQFGAIFQAPGVIDYKVAGFTLVEDGPSSARLATLLTDCGLDGRVSDNITREIWRKLIFNCVINPITSITGTDVGSIADPRLDPVKRLVIDECLAVARADGVTFDIDFVAELAAVFGPSRNIASMRQDLLKHKPTEIDYMNGAVVERGRALGIACPVNAALVAMIKALEAQPAALSSSPAPSS